MSKVSLIVSLISQNRLFIHVDGIKQHPVETIFKGYESLTHGSSWKEINFHVNNMLFSHRRKLFIQRMEETGHQIKRYHAQHHQDHHM